MQLYEKRICELIWNISIKDEQIDIFSSQLSCLLEDLKNDQSVSQEYLCCLFCMIGYSRDIMDGCGERDLSYRIIYIWYLHFPVLTLFALHTFFISDYNENGDLLLPYGSWKDLKYFCRYIAKISNKQSPLIYNILKIANNQLRNDYFILHENSIQSPQISFLSKWIPKETGAFSWVFDALSSDWDPEYGHKGFAKKNYRKLVSSIKSIGIEKNHYYMIDHYYDTMFIGDYIQGLITCNGSELFHWVNRWDRLVHSFPSIYNAIPIIQLSSDILDDQLYHMIGYACLIISRSSYMKRVLLISTVPIWLDVSTYLSIDSLVNFLWSYCKNIRTIANWSDSIYMLKDALNISVCPIQLFFFGSSFPIKLLCELKHTSVSIILWNIGSSYNSIPVDIDLSGFIFSSGRSATILRNTFKYSGITDYNYTSIVLQQPRFNRLKQYFCELVQNF